MAFKHHRCFCPVFLSCTVLNISCL